MTPCGTNEAQDVVSDIQHEQGNRRFARLEEVGERISHNESDSEEERLHSLHDLVRDSKAE